MPLIGPLYNRIAGFGSPGPSGFELIYNKAICIFDLVSMHFYSMIYEFHAHFHLSIALGMV